MTKERTSGFAENLRLLLDKSNLSQDELAKQLGVRKSAVSNWVNGIREPNLETLSKIADILCVSVDALFGRDDQTDNTEQMVFLQTYRTLNEKQKNFIMAQMDLIRKFSVNPSPDGEPKQ